MKGWVKVFSNVRQLGRSDGKVCDTRVVTGPEGKGQEYQMWALEATAKAVAVAATAIVPGALTIQKQIFVVHPSSLKRTTDIRSATCK